MEIVLGTYEQLILGYKLSEDDKGWVLDQSFNDHSHIGCVKCVAISKQGMLASGGADEMIKLFNLVQRKECGTLIHHEGTLTSINFFGDKNMFTTSEDGTVGIWKTGRWECLRTLRGHKDAVNCISVHPSGKMALTVSRDKKMKTWNLITGKCAYTTIIKKIADVIMWSPSGNKYVVVANCEIDVYDIKTCAIENSISCSSRINAVMFINDEILCIGVEGGSLIFHNIKSMVEVGKCSTETNRVKAMCMFNSKSKGDCLVTASSDGFLKVWELVEKGKWTLKLLAEVNTKFRLTSLAIHQASEKTLINKKDSMDSEVEKDLKQVSDSEDDVDSKSSEEYPAIVQSLTTKSENSSKRQLTLKSNETKKAKLATSKTKANKRSSNENKTMRKRAK